MGSGGSRLEDDPEGDIVDHDFEPHTVDPIRNQGVALERTEKKLYTQLGENYSKIKALYPMMGKIVKKKQSEGLGSGFIFSKNLFVTAKHCLENEKKNLSESCVAFGEGKSKAKPSKIVRISKQVEASQYFPDNPSKLAVYELDIEGVEQNFLQYNNKPKLERPLYLFSYKTGTHLKVSQYPYLKSEQGYFLIRHRSGAGSSGGVYFNKNGEIVGIHLGCTEEMVKNTDETEHIALNLWNSGECPLYFPEKNPKKNTTVSGRFTADGIKIKYREVRVTDSERSVLVSWKKNKIKCRFEYSISPNPHQSPKIYEDAKPFYHRLGLTVYDYHMKPKDAQKGIITVLIKKEEFKLTPVKNF